MAIIRFRLPGVLTLAQYGYCRSGQVIQAAAPLASMPKPTDANIDGVMSANLCRCVTCPRIRAAIHLAARGGDDD